VDAINLEYALDDEDRLLDDLDLYNFGDQWQQILDVMPELVRCDPFDWASHFERIRQGEDKC
jgi:hypothetical protein